MLYLVQSDSRPGPQRKRRHHLILHSCCNDYLNDPLPHFSGTTNALIRNTCAPTMMQGSDQLNVMPRTPHMDLDCRLLPGTGPQDLIEMLKQIIDDGSVQIQATCEVEGLAEKGLPVTSAEGPQWNFVKKSIT
jgi:acetylornithine deacetylase/succinyl-diaminopimelate desuccinylase-like protein